MYLLRNKIIIIKYLTDVFIKKQNYYYKNTRQLVHNKSTCMSPKQWAGWWVGAVGLSIVGIRSVDARLTVEAGGALASDLGGCLLRAVEPSVTVPTLFNLGVGDRVQSDGVITQ